MRTTRALGLGAFLAATTLLAPLGAAADPSTTVSGQFQGKTIYDHCTAGTPESPGIASGTWSVTLHGPSAKADFALYVDGELHVAYKFGGMQEAPNSTPSNFIVYGKTLAGLLTVSVKDGKMAYTIAPYSLKGLVCDSVTFPGVVDRD